MRSFRRFGRRLCRRVSDPGLDPSRVYVLETIVLEDGRQLRTQPLETCVQELLVRIELMVCLRHSRVASWVVGLGLGLARWRVCRVLCSGLAAAPWIRKKEGHFYGPKGSSSSSLRLNRTNNLGRPVAGGRQKFLVSLSHVLRRPVPVCGCCWVLQVLRFPPLLLARFFLSLSLNRILVAVEIPPNDHRSWQLWKDGRNGRIHILLFNVPFETLTYTVIWIEYKVDDWVNETGNVDEAVDDDLSVEGSVGVGSALSRMKFYAHRTLVKELRQCVNLIGGSEKIMTSCMHAFPKKPIRPALSTSSGSTR